MVGRDTVRNEEMLVKDLTEILFDLLEKPLKEMIALSLITKNTDGLTSIMDILNEFKF